MKSHFRIRTLWSVWLPGVLGVVVASLSAAEVPPPSQSSAPRTNATALVIIDVQNFYFPGGSLPLAEPAAASAQATKLLERFRALGWPVVHVQHLPQNQSAPAPDSGDPQYRIHSSVLPATGEKVIGKHHANAFRDTGLLAALREMGAGRLVIAGMQTHMCVEAATRAAADLGFDVVVAHDACATRSLKFKGAEIPATQVHAATLAALQGNYARVISTDDLLAELK
jgi:nicotinamidase-related amidase